MDVGFLIASPQLRDPTFEGTVVLLCRHDEAGAIGLVINRATDLSLRDVLAQMDLRGRMKTEGAVLWGGPVEPGAGFVVFQGSVSDDDGWNLGGGVAVSPSRDQLASVVEAATPFHLCLGYAGWSAGQLDAEMEQGSWLWVDLDADILFNAPLEARYKRALGRLGLSANQVWMQPIDE